MGSLLSRVRPGSKSSSTEDDHSVSPSPSSRDALSLIAAEHWLSLHQLHLLFIADHCHPSLTPPLLLHPPSCHEPLSSSSLLSSAPPLSPVSPLQCSSTRHLPSCCCASSSSSFPSPPPPNISAVSLPSYRPLSLLDFPALPPPSPADRSIGPFLDYAGECYRPAGEREAIYLGAIRPLLHSALLDSTSLDPDSLTLILDYAVQPPTLSPHQLIGLALLSPQHLHRHDHPTPVPASPAFTDLVLSSSGCFIHRRGVVDRAMSLRAQELRLNFATVQKGRWKVSEEEGSEEKEKEQQQRLQLEVYRTEELYFDQRLYKDKGHRTARMTIVPYEEEVAKLCCKDNPLCLVNDLLVVCGQHTLA